MQAEGMHMNMKTLEVLLNVSEQLIDGQLCKQMLVVQLDVWSIRAEHLSLSLWYFLQKRISVVIHLVCQYGGQYANCKLFYIDT